MQKKNTLLYLNKYLVERAKKENINISRLAEEALRKALGENRPVNIGDYLQEIILREIPENRFSRHGEKWFLPFQIESLKLENIGNFKFFDETFSRDSLNIIYGPGASGKSTILHTILLAFGRKHRYFNESRFRSGGSIKLKLFPNQNSINISNLENTISNLENSDNLTKGYGCFVSDDPLSGIPRKIGFQLLNELAGLGIQVIITMRASIHEIYLKTLPKETHIISLENDPYY